MAESADRTAKSPSQEGDKQRRPERPAAPSPSAGIGGEALLLLQDALGNRSLSRLIENGAADPGGAEDERRTGVGLARRFVAGPSLLIARQPNASMPPPNQSTTSRPPGLRNNGINHQGDTVFPDADRCKAILKKQLPEKGFLGASGYGHSFVNPASEEKLGWALFADEDYIQRCQSAMRSAVTDFDEDCRIFMEKFETKAGNITDAMLTNAEEQILKEQKKLGLKATFEETETGTSTSYTASNKGYLTEAKNAAAALATRREEVDGLGRKSAEARGKVERASAPQRPSSDQPIVLDATKPVAPLAVVTSPVGLPAFIPQALVDEQESTHTQWQEAEDDFKKRASDATGKYASLGPLLTGGMGTAQRLKAFASETAGQSEQRLGEDFAKKLDNIATVRGELGKRFSIWKQPTILSITHQQMASGPGEQRLVRDKVKQIEEDEKNTREMYAAIALGLGLLAAIPSGGSSLIAGVALAASVTGAAMSAYGAYEESQNYLLQSAAANTSLDRAYQISQSEPSLLWLAIDIAAAVADLGAAKAAFTALKETIAVAKAARSMEKLPEVVGAMRRAGVSPANQGRVLEEILPAGGDIGKALHEIRQAFIRTAESAADKEMAALMKGVAERALDNGRVIVIPNSRAEALEVLRFRLGGRGFKGEALEEEAASIIEELFGAGGGGKAGVYDPPTKLVYIRGNTSAEGAASVLVHEMTHLGQDTMKMMQKMGRFKSEAEAFVAQQQFLKMLPPDRVPPDWRWLLEATPDQIEQHVLSFYAKEGAVSQKLDQTAMVDGIYNTLFQAGAGAR